MGEVVGAGLVAHVPTIMLPEETRRELNRGEDFSLVRGLEDLRSDVFEQVDHDTVVVLDSHWFTTVEFVVTAQDRRAGLFTSEELPRGMMRIPFDWLGDPELAGAMERYSPDHATWVTAIDDQYLPVFYATVNLWKYLGEGLDKRWISVSVAQTGVTEDFLRAGRALGQAIEATDRKVMLIASGAMSPTFWKLRELRDHETADLSSIRTPEARAADEERIGWLKEGDHAKVLDTMDDFLQYRPESMFAHYLMMLGAIGEGKCTAPARQYGEYENSIGTGQVHLWCDQPDGGFPRQNETPTDPEFLRQQEGPDIAAAG
jgi:aromatic ring-opening dioxygenase catalytic subunit (LigB family)